MKPTGRTVTMSCRRSRRPGAIAVAALCLALMLPSTLAAHSFTAVGATNGLEARIVPSLLLDRDGFLWVGSREGLFRYDGYEPLAFLPDAGAAGAISDIDVRCIYQDSSGDLWVGTYSGGLNLYDAASGSFRQFRHDSADPGSIVNDSVLAIAEGPGGGLWTATAMGLSRLDRATGRFEHYTRDPADARSISSDQVTSLHRSDSGRLWIGTIGGGVNLWQPESRSFSRFDLAELTGGAPELNDIFSLHEDRSGQLWLGTRIGLVILDTAGGTARELPLPGQSEFLPAITAMAAGQDGRLWLGTLAHGVLTIDMQTAEWERGDANQSEGTGHLADQPQLSLALSEDMLFVGTWSGGVYRTTNHSTDFALLNRSGAEALRSDNVTAVLATEEAGQPWLGTQDGGPVRASILSRQVEFPADPSSDLGKAFVGDLARDSEGQLWAGTSRGLFKLGERPSPGAEAGHEPSRQTGLGEESVRALLPAEGTSLWVGTDGGGLYYRKRAGEHWLNFRHQAGDDDSLSGDFVTALLPGMGDRLWVGTRSNGLNLCRIENWSCERFGKDADGQRQLGNFNVSALFRDRNGEIWVGTSGRGLHQVLRNAEGGVAGFRRWTQADGLLDETIMSLEQDLDGTLWLSTRRGLTRLHPGTGEVINYVRESGLPTEVFNGGASAADSRYIYFGSADGLLSFPKGSDFTRRRPAQVRIASIERAPPGEQNQPVHWAGDRLSVAYGDVLSIKLATLDLAESSHEYAYRLRADDPWTAMGTQRQLIVHGLAPGDYPFQARGRDVFGSWGESSVLTLEVVPPFWMTNTFRGVLAALLVLTALGVHRARQAALQRRALEIQRLSQKREEALEQKLGHEAELAVLTPRQKEVLQLVAEGHATKEIAERLGVSVKTVEAHRANLMDRLEIRDVPGLVRLAIRSGLVSPYE
ncbi:MAG TPA: two-component regulator propeller domain-containing protein [Xanthomonadales bacterium]|nr:two-component regulator propeller domain-containing protein [Xanthomonadales bacterium]